MEIGYYPRRVFSRQSRERWYEKVFGFCAGCDHSGFEDGTNSNN